MNIKHKIVFTLTTWAATLLLGLFAAPPASATDVSVDVEEWLWMCTGDDAPTEVQNEAGAVAVKKGFPASTRAKGCLDMTLQLMYSKSGGVDDIKYKNAYLRLENRSGTVPCSVKLTTGDTLSLESVYIEADNFTLYPVNKNARVFRFHVPNSCRYVFDTKREVYSGSDGPMRAKTLYKDEMFDHPSDPNRKCGKFNFGGGDTTPTQRECFEGE